MSFFALLWNSIEYKLSIPNILSHQLVFFTVSHLLDDDFQVSIKRHQEAILLAHDLFLVEELLHGFVVSLFGVEGQSLKLHLILSVVKDGLGQKDVGWNGTVEVFKLWPSSRVDGHGVELVSVFESSFALSDIFSSHGVDEPVFSLLEHLELLLGHVSNIADLGPPPFHIVMILLNSLVFKVEKELIFNLGLTIPIIIFMLLSGFAYEIFKLFSFVFKLPFDLTFVANPQVS